MSAVYLSRIQLNPRRREARWLLGSPQRVHAAVLQSFPDPPTGDRSGEPRVLWRLDHDHDRVLLYVVSPDQPDFAHLAEQAGWPTTERGTVKRYEPLLDRLELGQRWAFRLTANPTQYLRRPDQARAQRVGHVTVGYQELWLQERAAALGFRIAGAQSPELVVTRRAVESFTRRDPSFGDRAASRRTVTLAVAQFDGALEVTDPQALRTALVVGIGPAKAYGCGLLTLAPLR
ncbi:MAG: type I-E CRISPR-associated protein Cas6/Cse3/CasE [Cellulomonas sp.]|nr:type I-E CRISPR-associated protein Cas6/Cse3/CasE [Cellulomonas sp.]